MYLLNCNNYVEIPLNRNFTKADLISRYVHKTNTVKIRAHQNWKVQIMIVKDYDLHKIL